MTLRRTTIARRTELRRSRALRGRSVRKPARPRDTGPSPAQRNTVAERAQWCCELCGVHLHRGGTWTRAHSFHHRQPRGAGGTTRVEVNHPSNVLLVCGTGTTGCHGSIESNRTIAYLNGWLVRHPQDPGTVPVWVRWNPAAQVLLHADGGYQAVAT